ncbi:MAG: T9SS type A sorting domain-containing protein [Chitinophagales bacterium]|nr:T9SS type A sorting domain-containing protein [Chitinophagales bacterium]
MITCRYYIIMAMLLPAISFAKGENATPATSAQFIANKGQVADQYGTLRRDIDAKIEAGGVTMFVGDGQLHYQWVAEQGQKSNPDSYREKTKKFDASRHLPSLFSDTLFKEGIDIEIYRMDVTLVGANKSAEAIFEEPTGDYENYYLPQFPDGVTARGYNKVTYKNIYPNIDWVIYTPPAPLKGGDGEVDSRGIKYDFIVHPGGDPADIRLRYNGATGLNIVNGALQANTPFGTVTEDAPFSYDADTRQQVVSAYVLSGNELSFGLQPYDGTLVIDPALNWATYYGGIGYEQLEHISVDSAGNVYLGGWTTSSNNIATSGAFNTTAITADWNMFVAKFNTSGVRQWGTYFADTGYVTRSIGYTSADRYGNVYMVGATHSVSGIATSGTYQGTHQGLEDGFIIKFNTAGQRIWATYVGGSDFDGLGYIHISAQGQLIVIGSTNSASGIATSGTYKPNYHINNGGCLMKFDSSGQRIWGTYTNFGGDIATDIYGNIYIGGWTYADTGIATTGAHQTSRVSTGNVSSAILVKFDSTGNRLWGTYYGGAGQDYALSVVVTSPGDIYISGGSSSSSNIATTGSFNPSLSGSYAGFLAKFNAAGTRQWGTYYNGTRTSFTAAAVADGDIIVTSMSQVTGLATSGAYQTSLNGSNDGFWARFTPTGQRTYATYFGGNGIENVNYSNVGRNTIAMADKYLYICGSAGNSTGLTTTGAHQPAASGSVGDFFLVQFELEDTLVFIPKTFNVLHACATDTLHVPLGVTRNFGSSNNFIVQLSNSSGSFASPVTLATVNSNTAGTIACYLPGSIPDGTGYKLRVIATAPADTSLPSDVDIAIYRYPASFTSGSNSPVCTGKDLQLNSGTTTTGVSYAWTGPGSFSSSSEDPMLPNSTLAMTGDYYITVNNNGCMVRDTVSVVVNQTPENVMAAGGSTSLCTGDTLKLTSSSTTSGVSYAWTGPTNYNTQQVNKPNVQLNDAGTYKVTVTLGNCFDTASTTVTVDQSATVNVVPLSGTSVCAGSNASFASFVQFAGTGPQLQWMINGVDVPGATNQNFNTSTLNDGDKVSMKVTPNTTCPGTRVSNDIPMQIMQLKAPSATITADAGPSLFPNEPINFTAATQDAGTNPKYQWKRNGQSVGGATGKTWGANANFLTNGDNICVLITSDYACPNPDTALSNCIKLEIRLGVEDIVRDNNIRIYPNPTSGTITVTSSAIIEQLMLTDLLGQQVLSQTGGGKTVDADMSNLAAGVYIIKVNGSVAGRVIKK